MIDFETFTKITKECGRLGKFIAPKGFKKLPKAQKIAKSGQNDLNSHFTVEPRERWRRHRFLHVAKRPDLVQVWKLRRSRNPEGIKIKYIGAVVVAQLVERSLPIPEVRGSNPVIGKKLYWIFTVICIEKTKIKKKRPEMPIFKTKLNLLDPSNVTPFSTYL